MTENKLDKKVVEEKSYRTSDDKLFTGKGALIKSEEHQKGINKENRILTFSKEARNIFGLPEEISDSNEEEKFLNVVDSHLSDFDYFEGFFENMIKLYTKYPGILDMFKLIDREFKKEK